MQPSPPRRRRRQRQTYTTPSPIERWVKRQGKAAWQLLVFVPIALLISYYAPEEARATAITITLVGALAIITGRWFA